MSSTEQTLAESQICSYCWKTCFSAPGYREFCHDIGLSKRFEYEAAAREIARNAEYGCPWCQALLNIFNRDIDWSFDALRVSRDKMVKICMRPDTFEPEKGVFELHIESDNEFSLQFLERVVIFTTESSPSAVALPVLPIRMDFMSSDCIDRARKWLEDCTRTHTDCQKGSSLRNPSRLIDLTVAPEPRLIMINDNEHYEYAALSYCWGAVQKGTLTSSNLDDRLKRIDLSEVSQAVKDAILVTSSIGLRYVWVDAMCIVQDDENDKVSEIALMCDVYSNACLTISAANSDSASDTFLEPKLSVWSKGSSQILPMPIQIPFWICGEILSTCSVQSRRLNDPGAEPVNQRAWTLQESLLSRRTIHYTSTSIEFVCSTTHVSLSDVIHDNSSYRSSRLPLEILTSLQATGESSQDVLFILDQWISVCQTYSQRTIGLETERLTAFAGLAELFSKLIGQSYLAGLWTGASLLCLLHWQRDALHERQAGRLGDVYRAPTWSWMSSNDPVCWHYQKEDLDMKRQLAEVVSTSITLASQTVPFGRVKAGNIQLQGMIQKGTYLAGNFFNLQGKMLRDIRAGLDTRDHIAQTTRLTVYLFPLIECAENDRFGPMKGLILVPVNSGNVHSEYRRVGRFYRAELSCFEEKDLRFITLV